MENRRTEEAKGPRDVVFYGPQEALKGIKRDLRAHFQMSR